MIKYAILGIVQGLTEFLPVSSSAHLVIMQRIFGMAGEEIALSIILHLGTILALVVFFFKDILELLTNMKWMLLILIVTLITGAIAIAGKDFFEGLFSSARLLAPALIVTGTILILTRRRRHNQREMLGVTDAFILGVTQAIAIIPGISRSGITIATLLFRNVSREVSFKFSFLAAIPAVLGAALLEARKINFSLQKNLTAFSVGFILSFCFGLAALWILKSMVRKGRLDYFGYYCILVAILSLIFIR